MFSITVRGHVPDGAKLSMTLITPQQPQQVTVVPLSLVPSRGESAGGDNSNSLGESAGGGNGSSRGESADSLTTTESFSTGSSREASQLRLQVGRNIAVNEQATLDRTLTYYQEWALREHEQAPARDTRVSRNTRSDPAVEARCVRVDSERWLAEFRPTVPVPKTIVRRATLLLHVPEGIPLPEVRHVYDLRVFDVEYDGDGLHVLPLEDFGMEPVSPEAAATSAEKRRRVRKDNAESTSDNDFTHA